MTDEPTPEDLEQLARSVAMSGVLGDHDRLDVVAALRRLADVDWPTHGRKVRRESAGIPMNGGHRWIQVDRGGDLET